VISRLPWPDEWRIILISDDSHQGLSGSEELAGFKALPPFPPELAGTLCRLMLMQVLPALAEEDLEGFGSGVTQLQTIMGDHFAAAQGGRFASPHVAKVLEWAAHNGITGYGQSSWGPTGFLLIKNQGDAENLLRKLEGERYSFVRLTLCRGQNTGGTITFR
jgi:beta-RFAP synthase